MREAIASLPAYFRTETHIAGIPATDIHTLNSALGAAIEDQFVRTLNAIRHVWDPDERYSLYSFVRQSQTFPDVLLRRPGEPPVMGVELKGWYLLSREGEPSYRYTATPSASNLQDLIVLVPWALSNVISGTPIAFAPYIEPARSAAKFRNYWWMYVRDSRGSRDLVQPEGVRPYPIKADQINDAPVQDGGGNFGRYARTGIMNPYLAEMMGLELCGVRVSHWLAFFKAFQGRESSADIQREVERLAARIAQPGSSADQRAAPLIAILGEIERLLNLE